jgi:hypothetical protein
VLYISGAGVGAAEEKEAGIHAVLSNVSNKRARGFANIARVERTWIDTKIDSRVVSIIVTVIIDIAFVILFTQVMSDQAPSLASTAVVRSKRVES